MTESEQPTIIDMMKQQLEGLLRRQEKLEEGKELFTKAQGLDEAATKYVAENTALENELEITKKALREQETARATALNSSFGEIQRRMNKILPFGMAIIASDGAGLTLGLSRDSVFRSYEGLSGGEKIVFDAALSYVLLQDSKSKVIMIEAAELDNENLVATMQALAKLENTQVILTTCHKPSWEPGLIDDWTILELAEDESVPSEGGQGKTDGK